jgi:hypothetical protein
MPYPAITVEKAQELADLLQVEVVNLRSGADPFTSYVDESNWVTVRPGDDYERLMVERCASDLRDATIAQLRAEGRISKEAGIELEANLAGPIHSTLQHCSMDLLEDEDFWRYLALFPFRWYLIAREPELKPQDFGGFTEVDTPDGKTRRQVKSLITQLVYRTFLWGKIAFDGTARFPYSRATALSEADGPTIDIWHSHLIRTQLGQLGLMPHAFLDVILSEFEDGSRMKDPARETEKLLARVKHNVLFDVYEKDEADSIVKEQLYKIL